MQSLRQYRFIGEAVRAKVSQPDFTSESRRKPWATRYPEEVSSDVHGPEKEGPNGEERQQVIVEWESQADPLNPRNWPLAKRIWIFAIIWINVFAVDWASSADSQANAKISQDFHVSQEAETLSATLYVFGIACGALLAGPMSETVGRNPIYIGSRILHVVWLVGVALAPNFGAQCAFRFLAGLGGSILLAIHAASMADMFSPLHRTIAWPVIALSSFFGTAFAPIAGGWIAQSSISWRWTEWIDLILSGSTLILTLFFLPETFTPILLKWKAEHLRRISDDNTYIAYIEIQPTLASRFRVALLRALRMITREPIVVFLGLWLVILYICVFGFLQGFTYIFVDTFDLSRGLTGTCFVAIGVGTAIWTASSPLYYHYYKQRILKLQWADRQANTKSEQATQAEGDASANQLEKGLDEDSEVASISSTSSPHFCNTPGQDLPEPEYRLWSALLASPAFPISLFFLGWTNYRSLTPWPNLVAVVIFGFSWAGIYITVYQYILDVYGIYAGSALAIITFFRYAASGAANLFSRPMYGALGVHWTMTLLGGLAVLLAPVPLLLVYVGPALRKKSRFAGMYSRPQNERARVGRALGFY